MHADFTSYCHLSIGYKKLSLHIGSLQKQETPACTLVIAHHIRSKNIFIFPTSMSFHLILSEYLAVKHTSISTQKCLNIPISFYKNILLNKPRTCTLLQDAQTSVRPSMDVSKNKSTYASLFLVTTSFQHFITNNFHFLLPNSQKLKMKIFNEVILKEKQHRLLSPVIINKQAMKKFTTTKIEGG